MDDYVSRNDAIKTALTFFVEYLGGAFREDMQAILKKQFEEVPSADVIPVSWIEEQIKWLRGTGNAFAQLTAVNISSLLKTWRDEVKDG